MRRRKELLKILAELNDFEYFLVLCYLRYCVYKHKINTLLSRVHPPRPVILVSYLYIVYTVVATIIMIASQNLLVGVVLFGLFVVPLYAMIAYTRRLAKRYQTIRYHFIQNVQGEYNG